MLTKGSATKRCVPALLLCLALCGLAACRAAPLLPETPRHVTAARPASTLVAMAAATSTLSAAAALPAPTRMPGPTPSPAHTRAPTLIPPTATYTPTATPTATPTPTAELPTVTPTPPPAVTGNAGRVDAGALPPEVAGEIDALFAGWDRPDSPGCSLGLGQMGQLIYGAGYGLADLQQGVPITAGTVFNAGSLAKQFTAFAIELLREEGRLGLDDDLRRYVPELPAYAANITLREMLAHTSGLRDDRTLALMAGAPDDELLTERYLLDLIFRQQDTNFPPGEKFSYSNSNFSLLALIVRRLSGQPLAEFAQARLFAPLGMAHTSFRADPQAAAPDVALAYAPYDAGYRLSLPNAALPGPTDIYTTVGDLVRWADNYATARVGAPDGLDAMRQPARNTRGDRVNYNFGLQQRTYADLGPTLFHDGIDGGFRTALYFWPDRRRAAAVLCNVEDADADGLALQAARLWFGLPAATPTPGPTPLPTVPLESYVSLPPAGVAGLAGAYYDSQDTHLLRLYAEGDRLRVEDQPELELRALAPDHFRIFSSGSPTPGEAYFAASDPALEIKNTLAYNGSYRRYPDLAAGPDYTGTYYSPELDAGYRISLERGVLTLNSRRFVDIPLLPMDDDAPGGPRFEMAEALPPITVEFRAEPDNPGWITGFAFSLDRARNVRFDRAP